MSELLELTIAQRYGTSLAELEDSCQKIFSYRARQIKAEKRRARLERQAQPDRKRVLGHRSRRSHRDKLSSNRDKHVQLLRKVLALGCDSKKRFTSNWDGLWNTGHKFIERAILQLRFADGLYDMVLNDIELIDFSRWDKSWYLEVNVIWNHSIYHHYGKRSCVEMSPVDTFRLRRKYPSPIQRIQGQTKYNISQQATNLFSKIYQQDARPSKIKKRHLAAETGLPIETINNWFKNKRQRDTKATQSSSSESSVNQDQSFYYQSPPTGTSLVDPQEQIPGPPCAKVYMKNEDPMSQPPIHNFVRVGDSIIMDPYEYYSSFPNYDYCQNYELQADQMWGDCSYFIQ